jgi:hypothetical protein
MLSAEASGAQVESFGLTIYDDSNRVNIRYPASIGTVFRVAYIVTKLG